jgi:hypothetical protein
MQMDYNHARGFNPQTALLDELHEVVPNSTFLFIFRPIAHWINTVSHWNDLRERFSNFALPGLVKGEGLVSDLELARWWCTHVFHLREYVREYPSHALIELDLYDTKGNMKLLFDLFQANMEGVTLNGNHSSKPLEDCWGHDNVSPHKGDKYNTTGKNRRYNAKGNPFPRGQHS